MTSARYHLIIRGVRGSISHPVPELVRHGAHTTCAEIPLAPDRWLILDAGTGLVATSARTSRGVVGAASGATARTREFHILLTHYHRDHIEGLPFFDPLYEPDCRIVFYGRPEEGLTVRRALEEAIRPPWCPVPLSESSSEKHYVDIGPGRFNIGGLSIDTAILRHRPTATAFRIGHLGGALVFATDTEHGDPNLDAQLIALTRGADVLIHDAHYLPEEMETARGRGHSAWPQAVRVACESGVPRLVLFHHHPFRTDAKIDAITTQARAAMEGVEAAREGMVIHF